MTITARRGWGIFQGSKTIVDPIDERGKPTEIPLEYGYGLRPVKGVVKMVGGCVTKWVEVLGPDAIKVKGSKVVEGRDGSLREEITEKTYMEERINEARINGDEGLMRPGRKWIGWEPTLKTKEG